MSKLVELYTRMDTVYAFIIHTLYLFWVDL